jgi:hypothetical protein
VRRVAFWRHLGDLGRHFGPSWLPKGSQNHTFLHNILQKVKKWRHRNDTKKKREIWIENRSQNGRLGEAKPSVSLHTCFKIDVLGGSRKTTKNGCQNGSQKRLKWDQKSPGGRIFEILGRFGRRCFFDDFWDRKKSAQNQKNPTPWARKGQQTCKMGRPGGMCGATGEVRRG